MLERKIVVISPHYDDGVLSCGEVLAGAPGAVVITVFGGSPAAYDSLTPWDAACGFTGLEDVVAARREEDRRALRRLGASPAWLPFCDRQYGSPPAEEVIAHVLRAAVDAASPTAVLMPLGLFHDDHRLAHSAALAVRRERPHLRWVAYADAIYRRVPGLVEDQLQSLRAARIETRPAVLGIGRHVARKRDAVQCYESQLRALSAPGYPGVADVFRPESYWLLD